MSDFKFISHRQQADAMTEEAIQAVLELCGQLAETHAINNAPADSGTLRKSISHKVDDDKDCVYIGTNLEYAPYIEYGSGVYKENGGGGGWWIYVKGSDVKGQRPSPRYSYEEAKRIVAAMRAKGLDAHMSQGTKPKHFLKKALTEHTDEYRAIIQQGLRNKMN